MKPTTEALSSLVIRYLELENQCNYFKTALIATENKLLKVEADHKEEMTIFNKKNIQKFAPNLFTKRVRNE